jgi:hypothetical protein
MKKMLIQVPKECPFPVVRDAYKSAEWEGIGSVLGASIDLEAQRYAKSLCCQSSMFLESYFPWEHFWQQRHEMMWKVSRYLRAYTIDDSSLNCAYSAGRLFLELVFVGKNGCSKERDCRRRREHLLLDINFILPT